jgi:diguanylate cyclase (GGDEF)-like protein
VIRFFNTLRARFIFLAIMIVGCLTVILSSVITTLSDKQLKQEIGTSLAQDAFQTSDKLENFMWSRLSEVKLLSELDTLKNPQDPNRIRELLEKLNEDIPYYSWIGMLNPKGTVIASTNGILTGSNISQRPVYQQALKGPFIGDVHEAVLLAKLLPKPKEGPLRFVDISVPVRNDKGILTGILATHLSWEWAKAVEKSVIKPIKNKKIDIVVVSQLDNKVILGNKNIIGQTLSLPSIKKARNGSNSWALEKWPDGKTYLTGYIQGKGYMDYKGLGWTVLVRQPLSTAYAPIAKLKSLIIMIGIVFGIIFAIAAFLIARKVYKPLHEITEVANQIKEGKTIDIPIMKGIQEIEILSSSLRELIRSLVKTETKLTIMDSLAKHDPLTGLHNRMALDDHIHQAMAEAEATGQTLSILYIDLDNFKPVNDTFGHHIGDELLKEVAKVLARNTRGKDFAARIGGDEFVLALMTPKEDPIKIIRSVSHRIIRDLREPFNIEGNIVKIGCSIGGAVWPVHCDSVIDVMRLADESLYTAKRSGKNKLSVYGTSDHQVVYL